MGKGRGGGGAEGLHLFILSTFFYPSLPLEYGSIKKIFCLPLWLCVCLGGGGGGEGSEGNKLQDHDIRPKPRTVELQWLEY